MFNGKITIFMGTSLFLMGKSTISTGPFSSSQTVSLPEGIPIIGFQILGVNDSGFPIVM